MRGELKSLSEFEPKVEKKGIFSEASDQERLTEEGSIFDEDVAREIEFEPRKGFRGFFQELFKSRKDLERVQDKEIGLEKRRCRFISRLLLLRGRKNYWHPFRLRKAGPGKFSFNDVG